MLCKTHVSRRHHGRPRPGGQRLIANRTEADLGGVEGRLVGDESLLVGLACSVLALTIRANQCEHHEDHIPRKTIAGQHSLLGKRDHSSRRRYHLHHKSPQRKPRRNISTRVPVPTPVIKVCRALAVANTAHAKVRTLAPEQDAGGKQRRAEGCGVDRTTGGQRLAAEKVVNGNAEGEEWEGDPRRTRPLLTEVGSACCVDDLIGGIDGVELTICQRWR